MVLPENTHTGNTVPNEQEYICMCTHTHMPATTINDKRDHVFERG